MFGFRIEQIGLDLVGSQRAEHFRRPTAAPVIAVLRCNHDPCLRDIYL